MSAPYPPLIGFVGPSGCGKTTLLRQLAPLLRARGWRLGYLKHAHHGFDMDRPGKDSYRLRAAGATQILIVSDQRWALLREAAPPAASLGTLLDRFETDALDAILVEGFQQMSYPKIEVYRPAHGTPPLYPRDADIIAVATDADDLPADARPARLPLNDPAAVAEFVMARLAREPLRGAARTACHPTGIADPREELVTYYRWLRHHGYNDAHSGNASARVAGRFWVTPSGAGADTLRPEHLIECPVDGPLPAGVSLDAPLHQRAYRRQPEATGILHSHGAYSIAVSLAGRDFQPLDFEGQHYFATVPVLAIPYANYCEQAPERVAAAFAEHPLAIVAGHGVYAWGSDLARAYQWTCALELSAKIAVIARQAGTA